MNINELFWVINKGNIDEHFLDIQPNELAVKKKIDVDCDGLNSPLLFESESGIINLKRMIIEAEFWIEKKKLTLSRLKKYMSERETFAEIAEYDFNQNDGKELTLRIQRDKKKDKAELMIYQKRESDTN